MKGDMAAVDKIFNLIGKVMFFRAFKILKCKQDAEDVLSGVFLKIVNGAETFKKQDNAFSWIMTIVNNAAVDKYREIKRHMEVPIDVAIAQHYVQDDMDFLVGYVFKELPSKLADLYELVLCGYDRTEIANKLNISLVSVTRWREQLRSEMKKILQEE